MTDDLGMSGIASDASLDMDTPAFAKQALSMAMTSPQPALGIDSTLHHSSDIAQEEYVTNTVDATPPASASLSITTPVKSASSDQKTMILESLFPTGIPVTAISKAMFIASAVDELIAYVDGDVEALTALSSLISAESK